MNLSVLFFIDELTDWGADIIVIFNNQAAYSMLKCDNPRLRNIPVVFSGVYHPDRELIGQFPQRHRFQRYSGLCQHNQND